MVKVMLFDADGVIIHRKERFTDKLARENNIDKEDIMPFFKNILSAKCQIGKGDLRDELVPWLKKWKWTGTADELMDYWFKGEANVDDDVIRYIKNARQNGVRYYLVTNNEIYRTNYLRKNLDFENIFDGVFTSAEIGVKKPSFEYYEYVWKDISKDVEMVKKDVLYYDDENENVGSAIRFGFESVLFVSTDDLVELD